MLPNDVVEDILVRMPVESLLRFKSVNKYFCSLIRNPNFVYKQLDHRQHNGSIFDHALIALVGNYNHPPSPSYNPPPPSDSIPNMLVHSPTSDDNIANWSDAAAQLYPSLLPYSYFQMVGHCNGLICVRNCLVCVSYVERAINEVFILWNPFLRQHKKLPVSRTEIRGRVNQPCFGFGHDPQSRDYKLVILSLSYDCSYFSDNVHVIKADIYSLRNDSWREVALSPAVSKFMQKRQTRYVCGDGDSVCLGRFCYWLGRDPENLDRRILVFDLSEEVFRGMSFPRDDPRTRWKYNYHTKLMVWNDSIAVVAYPYEGQEPKCLDVWLLDDVQNQNFDSDEDGVAILSVKKYFSIELDQSIGKHLEVKLVWDDELILNQIRIDNTNNYHLSTLNTLKTYKGLYTKPPSQYFEILGFIKSLIPVI